MPDPRPDKTHRLTGKTLLVSLAHPDDESFGSGGTLAHYAALGANVVLICATNGDVGEISDKHLATSETLAQVRTAELRCACLQLGVKDLRLLDYRDSGMAGTPANEQPDTLYQADLTEVTGKIARIIREVKPEVVITFDENGGYGHPDHVAVHKATVAAFSAAADPTQYPAHLQAGLDPYQPQKLYYSVVPQSLFKRWGALMAEQGIDITRFGTNKDINLEEMGTPDDLITTQLELSPQAIEARRAAIQCHQTQITEDSPFRVIPEEELRQTMQVEAYILVQGEAEGTPEKDLFAGIV